MTESACQSLMPTEAEELIADISRILRQSKTPKANLTKEEFKAMKELKSDGDHIILTPDKGVALVVMDKSHHIKKVNELLEDTNTYRPLNMDPPTNRRESWLTS